MNELEKSRAQHDAQRSAATRPGSSAASQALIRHLGVALYRESRHRPTELREPAGPADTDGQPDR
jgi:hypothetical protein